jgi:hypothetical protein
VSFSGERSSGKQLSSVVFCFRGASVLNNASLSGESSLRGSVRCLDAVNEIA